VFSAAQVLTYSRSSSDRHHTNENTKRPSFSRFI